ncbi:MAG: alpha/beta hydrolase [Rhodobacteraceae bacterium]|nr:alpha/beta hydrolase [Paracoccaceae bacterium]
MKTGVQELSHGRRIAFCRSPGRGPGIVFLGGFMSDMTGTKAMHLQGWARRRSQAFLRFDYTGHGESSGLFRDGCIGDWLSDAEDIIAELTEGPQILVGSSMGGWIALLLAKRCPERIAGFVGIATAPDFTAEFEHRLLTEDQLREISAAGFIQLQSDYDDGPYILTQRLLHDGRRHSVFERPLRLPFPVRLLQGTSDTDVDPAIAVKLLNHVSGADIRLTLVKGADHRFSDEQCLRLIEHEVTSILDIHRN